MRVRHLDHVQLAMPARRGDIGQPLIRNEGGNMLKDRLRRALTDRARTGSMTTYRELAQFLGLEPPHTIQQVAEALESLMEEDVAASRPILSAICVSKMRPCIPARGFFLAAQDLGIFSGDPSGPEARAFHAAELQRVLSFYGVLREDSQAEIEGGRRA
jgi:hypothetical protein